MMSALEQLGSNPSYEALKKELLSAFNGVEALNSLIPCPDTNAAFGRLVTLVTSPFVNLSALSHAAALDPDFLARKSQIIALCAASEAELEKYWATKIVEEIGMAERVEAGERRWPWSLWRASRRADVDKVLQQFPYVQNYQQLVSLEYHLLHALGADFSQIIFLGSGPLPLSSLLLAKDHLQGTRSAPCTIINIDQDLPSLTVGACLTSSVLGVPLSQSLSMTLPTRQPLTISSLHYSALSIPTPTLSSATVLILAALVGLSPAEKNDVLFYLLRRLPVGAYVLLRSAEGLRGLVYPVVDVEGLLRGAEEKGVGVRELLVTHPKNQVVNSIIVLQRV